MSQTVRIHLSGGPCNGENATVQRAGDLLPGYTCKNTDYQPTAGVTATGRVIYTTAASQQPPPTEPVKTHALHSWRGLTKAGLHDLPTSVQRANEHLRTLRRLTRSH